MLHDELLPEWDQVDWQSSPALSYSKGLADGYQLGLAEYDRELVAALAYALGGSEAISRPDAVKRHLRALAQFAGRRAWDEATRMENAA